MGDISYSDDRGKAKYWDSFGEYANYVAANIPWNIAPGNHEI